MNKLRWGVLGVSKHYRLRVHLPFSGFEGAELYAIASRDAEKAAAAAAELGFKKSYGSYEELVSCPDVDAVYIPLPNDYHCEWVKKAAAAGKHILCEKPLAMSLAELEDTFAFCHNKNVRLMEAFMFRFHPQWVRVKELVDSGEIGGLKAISCVFSYNNTDPENIRNQPAGGAMRDIGCYGAAVTNLLTGRDPDGIKSFISRDPDFGTDELTSFIMDYNGCHSLVTVSTQAHSEQNIKITGRSGSIEVYIPFNVYNDVPARVKVISGVGERIIKTEPVDQYRCELEAFTTAVLSRDDGFFTMMEEFSHRNQQIIDAVFSAAD